MDKSDGKIQGDEAKNINNWLKQESEAGESWLIIKGGARSTVITEN